MHYKQIIYLQEREYINQLTSPASGNGSDEGPAVVPSMTPSPSIRYECGMFLFLDFCTHRIFNSHSVQNRIIFTN